MTKVNEFLYDGETVCIGRKGTIDKPMYYNGKIWTVDTLFYTHKFRSTIPKFIFYLFQQINWKLYNEASGVPSLSKATIEKLTSATTLLTKQYEALEDEPEAINEDPYANWIIKVKVSDAGQIESLMDVAAYRATL